jgi:HNH endonuclease
LQNINAAARDHGLTREEIEFSLMITMLVLPNVLANAPTTQSDRKADFKKDLCDHYNCHTKNGKHDWVRCMVLDTYFPSKLVTAAHLFRRSTEYLASMVMKIDDIDDMKNGMLLFKPLEKAFDHFQISFLSTGAGMGSFHLKLFDNQLQNTKLVDFLTKNQKALLNSAVSKWGCKYRMDTTFEQVDGYPIAFKNLHRPYNRCLNLQARIANFKASKEGRTDSSFKFDDFWSENMSLEDKMGLLRKSMSDDHERTEL